MKRWGDLSQDDADQLAAESVLDHAEMAVVVTDRFSNLLYWNPFAEKLFGRPSKSVARRVDAVARASWRRTTRWPSSWPSTCSRAACGRAPSTSRRGDGTIVYVRAQAVPLRHPSGSVTGIVITAREALRSNEREKDRFGLLERIGERLAGSLYVEETLKRVAEMLVPQFADHCFIELMEGDRLVRRVSQHVQGWSPPPGTWKPVGAEIRYPAGHYADTALRRQETDPRRGLRHQQLPRRRARAAPGCAARSA